MLPAEPVATVASLSPIPLPPVATESASTDQELKREQQQLPSSPPRDRQSCLIIYSDSRSQSQEQETEMEKEKRRNHGGLTLLAVLVVLPSLLPRAPAAVAADSSWHPNPPTRRGHHGGGSNASPRAGLPPLPAPAPAPIAGADDLPAFGRAPKQAPPHFGFPLQPTFGVAAPPVAPTAGEGYPFIGSNPTVPLPTGMTDTSTVLPLPDRGDGNDKVVGRAAPVRVQIAMIGLVAAISILFLSGRS
uniref:Uncharacterized protein n=1 Tax=Oryza punctata TaxID=4537 RepID=A0A0E0JU02_ORYPU